VYVSWFAVVSVIVTVIVNENVIFSLTIVNIRYRYR